MRKKDIDPHIQCGFKVKTQHPTLETRYKYDTDIANVCRQIQDKKTETFRRWLKARFKEAYGRECIIVIKTFLKPSKGCMVWEFELTASGADEKKEWLTQRVNDYFSTYNFDYGDCLDIQRTTLDES